MGHIVSFEIHGLAGRRKTVKHILNRHINVFWGANGSGKTSMLKILHSALLNDATSLLRVPFTKASVQIVSETRQNIIYTRTIAKSDLEKSVASELTLDMDDDEAFLRQEEYIRQWQFSARSRGVTRAVMPKWKTEPENPPGPTKDGSFSHGYLPISRVSEARTRRAHPRPVTELIDEASFDRLFALQIRDLWSDYNQRALLQIRNAQERGIARILRSVLETGETSAMARPVEDAEEAYELVSAFFRAQRLGAMLRLSREAFTQNYDSKSLIREVVAEVADVQRGIELAQEPQHRIEALLGRLYGGKKKVELRGREVVVLAGNEAIPLESLSSGEKQLMQLLLECLSAGNASVLIDEPELSLHVDWQNELIECMRTVNDSAQLIMATHSPEVMARLANETVFEL